MAVTSEPAPGSEMAAPITDSPAVMGGRNRSFCSSVPYSRIASAPKAAAEMQKAIPGSTANSSSTMIAMSTDE